MNWKCGSQTILCYFMIKRKSFRLWLKSILAVILLTLEHSLFISYLRCQRSRTLNNSQYLNNALKLGTVVSTSLLTFPENDWNNIYCYFLLTTTIAICMLVCLSPLYFISKFSELQLCGQKLDHITPILCFLHLLQVCNRIDYSQFRCLQSAQ